MGVTKEIPMYVLVQASSRGGDTSDIPSMNKCIYHSIHFPLNVFNAKVILTKKLEPPSLPSIKFMLCKNIPQPHMINF